MEKKEKNRLAPSPPNSQIETNLHYHGFCRRCCCWNKIAVSGKWKVIRQLDSLDFFERLGIQCNENCLTHITIISCENEGPIIFGGCTIVYHEERFIHICVRL